MTNTPPELTSMDEIGELIPSLDRVDESKSILYLRRRALLMELALIEDELGIERSVKRK